MKIYFNVSQQKYLSFHLGIIHYIFSTYSQALIKLASAMLEKTLDRRPFIDEIIEMFPKSLFKLTDSIDIFNFREYKKQKPKNEPRTKIERDLEHEYQLLKKDLLDPDPDKFLAHKNYESNFNPPIRHMRMAFISNNSDKGMKIFRKRHDSRWISGGTYYSNNVSTERWITKSLPRQNAKKFFMFKIGNQMLDRTNKTYQELNSRNLKGNAEFKVFKSNRVPLKLTEDSNQLIRVSKDRLLFVNKNRLTSSKFNLKEFNDYSDIA